MRGSWLNNESVAERKPEIVMGCVRQFDSRLRRTEFWFTHFKSSDTFKPLQYRTYRRLHVVWSESGQAAIYSLRQLYGVVGKPATTLNLQSTFVLLQTFFADGSQFFNRH